MPRPCASRQLTLAMFAVSSAFVLHKRRHSKSAADVAHSDSQHARHTVAVQNAHLHHPYLDAIQTPSL